METLTRDSISLCCNNFIISDLDGKKTILINPWEGSTFIPEIDSFLETISEIALSAINFVGSLFIEIRNYFNELSQSKLEVMISSEDELQLSKNEDNKEEQFWNDMKLDPKLVKKSFNRIDRKALMSKLAPILDGNVIQASMLSTLITNCKSYSEAINLLVSQVDQYSTDEFYEIVDAIKSELYSEVK